MITFPDTNEKLKETLSRHKRALLNEKQKTGRISDGFGKRIALFWIYLILNNLEDAQEYFDWYENEFPEESGTASQLLCWAILLHRANRPDDARKKLVLTLLDNIHIIPHAAGIKYKKNSTSFLSDWPSVNEVLEIPDAVLHAITPEDKAWMSSLYHSEEFTQLRETYIQLAIKLDGERDIEKRTCIVETIFNLKNTFS